MNVRTIAILSGAALALAACNSAPQPLNDDEVAANAMDNVEEIMPDENAMVAPPPVNLTNTARAAPPPEVSDEEQVREDAEATGMTARLPQETGVNETQPAQ